MVNEVAFLLGQDLNSGDDDDDDDGHDDDDDNWVTRTPRSEW
jgi:hypothetical protein